MARQFETVAIPKRIQLVSPLNYRGNSLSIDAQMINCYAERDPVDGEYWIYKRPGYSAELLSPASSGVNPARGLYRYQGFSGGSASFIFLTVKNSRLSKLNSSATTTTLIGNIANAQTNYTFETIRSTPNYLAVLNDQNQAYYTDGTTITDMHGLANFPASIVRGWAYLDGYLFVMTPDNKIYGSTNLDDPTVWDLLNVIIARNGSDRSIALAKHKEYVAALKERSTEFFYNAGNATGSPLSSLRGSRIPYGCANEYTVQSIDEELIWLSRNEHGIYQIVRLTNLVPKIISNPSLDRILRTFDGWITGTSLQVSSFQAKLGGHRFYGVSVSLQLFNSGNPTTTFVYDLDQDLWYRWTSASSDVQWPVSAAVGPDDSGRLIMQNYSTGNIHSMAEDYIFPTDAGIAPLVNIYTVDHDFGTQRTKNLTAMYFRGDRIPGAILKLRWSDDDFVSFSNFREIDLNKERPEIVDLGSFYCRVWNLQHQAATKLRLKTTDLQLDIGQI